MLSAAVGCAFRLALRNAQWVAAPLSMATSLLVMQLTRTTHPPGHFPIHSTKISVRMLHGMGTAMLTLSVGGGSTQGGALVIA